MSSNDKDIVGLSLKTLTTWNKDINASISSMPVQAVDVLSYGLMMKDNDESCFYLNVHSNAGGGHGIEIFTSPGVTISDKIATILVQNLKNLS